MSQIRFNSRDGWKISEKIRNTHFDYEKTMSLKRKLERLEKTKRDISLDIESAKIEIKDDLERNANWYIGVIKKFEVQNRECIVDYLFLHRKVLDDFPDSDRFEEMKSLLSDLYERIIDFKYENIQDLSDEEVQELKVNQEVREDFRKFEMKRYPRKAHYITPENNKKAIELGFKNILEPINISIKMRETGIYFKYGRGRLIFEDDIYKHYYGFEELMYIITGPIFSDVFKILDIRYEFTKLRAYAKRWKEGKSEHESDFGSYGYSVCHHEEQVTESY